MNNEENEGLWDFCTEARWEEVIRARYMTGGEQGYGSFVNAILKAYEIADYSNRRRITSGFPALASAWQKVMG